MTEKLFTGTLNLNQNKKQKKLFILAGNEDMHRSLDEFEIRPDPPLVSMATDRVTVGKTVSSHFLYCF